MLEATGDPAIGQDVEEWAHLQYFARATDTPTFLISAVERDASRAAEVRTAMRTIGRRVIDIRPVGPVRPMDAQERRSTGSSPATLGPRPYALSYASTPEIFAPLVASIPLMLFAAYRAELLGEPYFRAFGGGRSIEGGGGISRIRTSEIEV
jgi:glucosamine--fructose-6-phosphate aminotransferase (isomerizing)